ncbi:MAG: hypothetical protein EOM91_20190 [Sphingobacteriia bacterium]|nr:hypothetical protein [Sphingobacteriia bacterium]
MQESDWDENARDLISGCVNWFDPDRYTEQCFLWDAEQWRFAVEKRRFLGRMVDRLEDGSRQEDGPLLSDDWWLDLFNVLWDFESDGTRFHETPVYKGLKEKGKLTHDVLVSLYGVFGVSIPATPLIESVSCRSVYELTRNAEEHPYFLNQKYFDERIRCVETPEEFAAIVAEEEVKSRPLLTGEDWSLPFYEIDGPPSFTGPRKLIEVDLRASDDDLKTAFSTWLEEARAIFHVDAPKQRPAQKGARPRLLSGRDIERWSRLRLLAYLDMNAWRRVKRLKSDLSGEVWSSILFPARSTTADPDALNLSWWTKKEYVSEVAWLLSSDGRASLKSFANNRPRGTPAVSIRPAKKEAGKRRA